jgi:hypothetical protein
MAYENSEKRNAYLRQYREKNRERLRENDRRSYQNNRDKRLLKRRRQSLKKYGLTIEDYDRMLVDQNGLCAICSTDKPGGQGCFHVDHNHTTGKVRKLLCTTCNSMLGMVNDDPRILAAGIAYLIAESQR